MWSAKRCDFRKRNDNKEIINEITELSLGESFNLIYEKCLWLWIGDKWDLDIANFS